MMAESADVAITTVMSILIITSIVGNLLVCAVVKKNRDMRTPINYLIVNLAVADIIYPIFLIPPTILRHTANHPEGVTGRILCTLLTDGNVSWVGAGLSVFMLVAIAIERYFAVIHPLGHKGKLTMGRLKVSIPVFWIFSLILNIPGFLNEKFDTKIKSNSCFHDWPEEWMPKAYYVMWFAFIGISFTLMVVLYSRVVHALWFKRTDGSELTYQQQGVLKVRKRVTLMVVTVSAIFGICWATDSILHVYKEFTSTNNLSSAAFPTAHAMLMFNSAVNPFAYALINQRFRQKIKKMICCNSSFSRPSVHAARDQDVHMTNITTQILDRIGDALEATRT